MPELPEVETMRRGILGVVGQRIRAVEIVRCRLKPILITPTRGALRRRTEGQRVESIDRLGKRVAMRLASGDSLIFEPRMTGLLLIADPPNQEHLRLAVHFSRGPVRSVWYWDRRGLGSVRLLTPDQLEDQLGPARLGPDALRLDSHGLQQQLGTSRREIKVALLDQRAVAGIGNLYASEILHVAGIDPRKRCHQMTRPMWNKLHKATQKVLKSAIKFEGSTLGDGTYRNALNKNGTYQIHHLVYMRGGEQCRSCRRAAIRRFVQAQRSTFYCPACQKKR